MAARDESAKPRILVVGYNAFDVIVPVLGPPVGDEKFEVPGMITCGGGPGATAALAMARLGARVKLMTPLTDDPPGQLQRRELLDGGVDLSLSVTVAGRESPKAVILVDEEKAQRTIFWTRGDVPHLPLSSACPDQLDGIDLLYTDGHEAGVSLSLARVARDLGLPIVMDAGSVRTGSRDLVAACSDVVSSRGFAPALTGQGETLEALRALRGLGPERVAMTFGGEGAIGLEGDRIFPVPAFAVQVKDTTGAGDAFHAGYAFARATGRDFQACLDWGCAVAGLKCRDWGGRRGLPDLAEVRSLMDTGVRVPLGALEARLPAQGS